MNVVYCVTADYIEKIKPSIKSLRFYNPKAKVYVVTETDEVDIEDVEVINVKGQTWFTPQNCVNYYNQFTWIAFMKVMYPILLKCDKAIHLDADTIVNGSLKELWDTDLKGKWFGMCQEYKGWYRPFGDRYYNAGVFVANLKQIRKDSIIDTMAEYLRTVKQPWGEQDALVKYALEQDKMVDVDVKYNENQFTGFTDRPMIVHYAGIGDWWTNQHMGRVEYLNRWK